METLLAKHSIRYSVARKRVLENNYIQSVLESLESAEIV